MKIDGHFPRAAYLPLSLKKHFEIYIKPVITKLTMQTNVLLVVGFDKAVDTCLSARQPHSYYMSQDVRTRHFMNLSREKGLAKSLCITAPSLRA